ncbi:MAG: hypothetical protein ACI3YH_02820, partial [Eubacteriales bacterium]
HIFLLFSSFWLISIYNTEIFLKKSSSPIDKSALVCYNGNNQSKTVEAKVKTVTLPQRVRGAEMRTVRKL